MNRYNIEVGSKMVTIANQVLRMANKQQILIVMMMRLNILATTTASERANGKYRAKKTLLVAASK